MEQWIERSNVVECYPNLFEWQGCGIVDPDCNCLCHWLHVGGILNRVIWVAQLQSSCLDPRWRQQGHILVLQTLDGTGHMAGLHSWDTKVDEIQFPPPWVCGSKMWMSHKVGFSLRKGEVSSIFTSLTPTCIGNTSYDSIPVHKCLMNHEYHRFTT